MSISVGPQKVEVLHGTQPLSTTPVSDTTMALVEDGTLFGSRQLDMANSGPYLQCKVDRLRHKGEAIPNVTLFMKGITNPGTSLVRRT